MEKALWTHDGSAISAHYFVSRLMSEYQFDFSMYYDKKLRQLYMSFDGMLLYFTVSYLSITPIYISVYLSYLFIHLSMWIYLNKWSSPHISIYFSSTNSTIPTTYIYPSISHIYLSIHLSVTSIYYIYPSLYSYTYLTFYRLICVSFTLLSLNNAKTVGNVMLCRWP